MAHVATHHPIHFGDFRWLYAAVAILVVAEVVAAILLAGIPVGGSAAFLSEPNMAP